MSKREKAPDFDWDARERAIALRFEQLAKYEAFDKLVDMALDGAIEMSDAKTAWENEIWVYDDGA